MRTKLYTILGYRKTTNEYIPIESVNSWLIARNKARVLQRIFAEAIPDLSTEMAFSEVIIVDADDTVIWSSEADNA